MRSLTILVSAVLLAVPAPLLAQNPSDSEQQSAGTTDGGNWLDNPRLGLLGLLGLGGLLRLMRREPIIHVDARQNHER